MSQPGAKRAPERLTWSRLHQQRGQQVAVRVPAAETEQRPLEPPAETQDANSKRKSGRQRGTETAVYFTFKPTEAYKRRPQRTKRKQEHPLSSDPRDQTIRCKRCEILPRRHAPSWRFLPGLLSMFMLSNGFGTKLMLTSAQQEPSALPLAYNMLHESGSGNGALGLASFSRTPLSSSGGSGSQGQEFASTNADLSPSLIEARCWNNYENDNDCKQLNVITAPDNERHKTRQQQQQQQQDDSIITPVVIFEASTVEPMESYDSNEINRPDLRPVFMAPPYQSGGKDLDSVSKQIFHSATSSSNSNKNEPDGPFAPLPTTSNSAVLSPVTRPSVFHFVATPQPKTVGQVSKRPKTKTTTQGRRCRDESDSDCDEPDDDGRAQAANSMPPVRADENEPAEDEDETNDRIGAGQFASASPNAISAFESGSGGGGLSSPNDDDNDDSTDDADEDSSSGGTGGDNGESSGANSIQEQNASNSAGGGDESAKLPDDGRLLVVTSIYPNKIQPAAVTSATADFQLGTAASLATTSTTTTTTRRPQNGAAEIEVVVHSTLPPFIPVGPRDHHKGPPSSKSTLDLDEALGVYHSQTAPLTTSTTPMPDDTVTSRPIFPSSTLQSQPVNQPDDDTLVATVQQGTAETTTEVDLYTFRPIPHHQEQTHELRPANVVAGPSSEPSQDSKQQASGSKQEVSSQHIHHEHSQPSSYRNSFDGWTTRRPSSLLGLNKLDLQQQQQSSQLPDVILGPHNSKRGPAGAKGVAHSHLGTDMLPTMLLYASVTILLFISLIFVVIAYGFWRRNNMRRRALLAKAQMLNGAIGTLPNSMIESMSHASHLMHGDGGLHPQPPPPQGLLSTYAPDKGLAMGKVTTRLVEPQGQPGMLLDEEEEEQEEQEEQEEGQEEDDADQQRRRDSKSNSKERLVNGDEGEREFLLDDQNQRQHQSRNSRPPNGIANSTLHNQSGSWSTDQEPTTTSSGSQRTQDSQQQLGKQQIQNPTSQRHHYPNSLSDGRQNSSSISDSQCSPDPGPSGSASNNNHQLQQQPKMSTNQQSHQEIAIPMQRELNMTPQRQFGPQQSGPVYHPDGGFVSAQQQFMGPLQAPGPNNLRQPFYPIMMQNGNMMKRLIASQSIEDIQPSQHVGFVESNNINQQVPYLPAQPPPSQQQHHPQVLPQLVQATPHYQQYQHLAGPSQMPNSLISPQRIAMNPLATMSRRYPPGSVLNRNIYSEDSSSFMTTSPSLARTSSSSSFAFNMSNLPTPSSIKAKPIIDASGRQIIDYTANFNDTPVGGGESNGNGTNGGPTAPPVFGRSDRSEAWYV